MVKTARSTRRSPKAAPPSRSGPRSSRHAVTLGMTAGIAVVVTLAFAGALGHGFLDYDDWYYVVKNDLVLGHRWAELLRAIVVNNYHPLTMLTLALNARSPLAPLPFLATNVALHVVNALLVFWLALRLGGGRPVGAAVAALAFGIHPMHVESVAWISERKDVLYTGFFLGASLAYERHLARRSPAMLGLAFALFVLSCLSKGMAVVFPLVMVLLDYWKGERLLDRRAVLEKLPFVAVALLFGAIAMDAQAGGNFHGWFRVTHGTASALDVIPPLTTLQRVVLPAYGYLMYLVRLVVPIGLAPIHPYPAYGRLSFVQLVVAPLAVIVTIALAVWDARRTRLITFAIGWYVVTIALVLQVIPVGLAVMSERYSYLAYVGIVVMLGVFFQQLLDRHRSQRVALGGLAVAVLALWFVGTRRQVETWRDGETLWSHEIAVHPDYGGAYARLGSARIEAGRAEEAIQTFQTARSLGVSAREVDTGLGAAHTLIGARQLQDGDPNGALAQFALAASLDTSEVANVMDPRAVARMQVGDYHRALADLSWLIEYGHASAASYYRRGLCERKLGDTSAAAADARQAWRLDPQKAALWTAMETVQNDSTLTGMLGRSRSRR